MAQWEAGKRWQRKEAVLKEKIRTLSSAVENGEKTIGSLRDTLGKMEREKNRLAGKVRKLEGGGRSGRNGGGGGPGSDAAKSAQALHELQGQVFGLQASLEERELEVASLQSKVAELELEVETLREAERDPELGASIVREGREEDEVEAEWHARVVAGQEKIRKLEKEVLELNNESAELRFELASKTELEPRLRERISQLEDHVSLLKASGAAIPSSSSSSSSSSDKKLQNVIQSQNRVIESLRRELEGAKKHATSNLKFMKLRSAHKELKAKYDELEGKYLPLKEKEELVIAASGKVKRLAAENGKLSKRLKAASAEAKDLRDVNIELRAHVSVLESDVIAAREAAAAASKAESENTMRSEVNLSERESELNGLLEEREAALSDARAKVRALQERGKELERELEHAQEDIAAYQKLNGGARNVDSILELEKENNKLKAKVEDLAGKNRLLQSDLSVTLGVKGQVAGGSGLAERVDELERENRRLEEELSGIGPEFFEEVENLKAAYSGLVKQCVRAQREYGIVFDGL